MRETWVRPLGWEDPLEKGKAAHSSFWPGEFHGLYNPWGRKESDRTEWLSVSLHFHTFQNKIHAWIFTVCMRHTEHIHLHAQPESDTVCWPWQLLVSLPFLMTQRAGSWKEFQHRGISFFQSDCAYFLRKISPCSPFCRCKMIFLSWNFFFLFFSVLFPPLNWLLIQRSLDLKIPGMIPMAEMGICSHQPSGSSGNIFSQHIKATSLYYTYFPKNRNALWFRKYFWALTPSQKHFYPSSKSPLKEHTYQT